MRKHIHPSRALRGLFLFSFAALELFAGYGTLRTLYAQNSSSKPHSVAVNWSPSVSPVAGYNVYRADPGGAPVKLTSKIVSNIRYVDRNVEAGHTYTYSVTSVDLKGVESKPSSAITVTVPGTAPPPAKR
jgi:fibronectin type 3 domain-containing protein